MLSDRIFYFIDDYLPRNLAAWPYRKALEAIQLQTLSDRGVRVWARNSFRKGNFTFGISDLDLTALVLPGADEGEVSRLVRTLEAQKKIYPYLGETNFYYLERLGAFESSLNAFERARDPELGVYLKGEKTSHLDIEKAVFLLRILYSDRKRLIRTPALRQKKWQEHFLQLGLPFSETIGVEDVLEKISGLLELDPFLLEETLSPLRRRDLNDENVFGPGLPRYWRFLYPHKHLWDHYGPESDLEGVAGTSLGLVCLKQIEWEIWGIMSQLPVLKKDQVGVRRHLKRLEDVSSRLSGGTAISNQVEALLRFI